MSNNYRHGDLCIKQIDELPKEAKKCKNNVLASGTATGHNHKINSKILCVYEKEGIKYIKSNKKLDLIHDEHETITLEKGNYIVSTEREYDPFKDLIKKVID